MLQGDYEPLPDVFSDELRDLVDRMLATDPDSRPSLDEIVRVSKEMKKRLSDEKSGGSKSSGGGSKEGGGKEEDRRSGSSSRK